MELEHGDLTGRIIGAAIQVHKELGPGYLESIYENALVVELRKRGLAVKQQHEMPILYDGVEVGTHRLELLVEDTIVVELKTAKRLEPKDFATVRSYLKALGQQHGLLLNFAATRLKPKRVILPDTFLGGLKCILLTVAVPALLGRLTSALSSFFSVS
jgi:GxxExxY protein